MGDYGGVVNAQADAQELGVEPCSDGRNLALGKPEISAGHRSTRSDIIGCYRAMSELNTQVELLAGDVTGNAL